MKQGTNNEMDLLLRRLGRRQDVFAPDAGDHLDADELNAYAENALPAAARLRYTEHLAECSRCREFVVQLSAAAGVVSAEQSAKVLGPSGWRKFLASLFSPLVLRYAAPALGLIVVAAIGVFMLRREPANKYVSQVQQDQTVRPSVSESPGNARIAYDSAPSPVDSIAHKEAETKSSIQPQSTPSAEKAPTVVAQNEPTAAKPGSQPAAAAESAPPPPKVEIASNEKQLQKNEDASRKQEAEVKVAAADVSKKDFEISKAENKRAEEPATARSRAAKSKSIDGGAASPQTGTAGIADLRPRRRGDSEERDSSAETKSVAGRHFRRQDGIWVDTAYESPRETINFTRGTESYRSLIADEPAIKTIADQLDGEFIVIWRGRAYRIR